MKTQQEFHVSERTRRLLDKLRPETLEADARIWWENLLTNNEDLHHIVAQLLQELNAAGMLLGELYERRQQIVQVRATR